MLNVILVVNGEKIVKDKIQPFLNKEQHKIVLTGLFSLSTEAKTIEEERYQWQNLFSLREEFEQNGFSVSIITEKGSVFNLINTVQIISAELLVLPKEKFLTLAQDEFDDFLTQLPCALILY
ncbi:MAG: hypothetical protein N2201_06095 [candidate division WOR-3 bacterium]|nr:hypothetical protein [candidate division WOR-3 bacterium]